MLPKPPEHFMECVYNSEVSKTTYVRVHSKEQKFREIFNVEKKHKKVRHFHFGLQPTNVVLLKMSDNRHMNNKGSLLGVELSSEITGVMDGFKDTKP